MRSLALGFLMLLAVPALAQDQEVDTGDPMSLQRCAWRCVASFGTTSEAYPACVEEKCSSRAPGPGEALRELSESPDAPVEPEADQGQALVGTWSGFYRCGQGKTALTLTIEPGRGRLKGIFAFGPHPGNPDIPAGSYSVNLFGGPGAFGIEPGVWIEQPPGYTTVGLEGRQLPSGLLSGRVISPACDQFILARQTETLAADKPGDTQSSGSRTPPAPGPSNEPVWTPLVGQWAGFMSCGSSVPFPVALRLNVETAGTGYLFISPYEPDRGVPTASHAVETSMRQGRFLLKRGSWIVKGEGWGFDYNGTLSEDGTVFSGTSNWGCDSVVLVKESAGPFDEEAVLTMSMPDYLADRRVPRIIAAAPAWLGQGEWLASGQCEAHPARIAFEQEGANLAAMLSGGVRAVLQAAEGQDYVFMDENDRDKDDTVTQVWAASQDHLLVRSSSAPDCISVYGRTPFSPTGLAQGTAIEYPEVAAVRAERQPGRPFGLAEVFGLHLGMSHEAALTQLVRIHAANAADVGRPGYGLTHLDLAPGAWWTAEKSSRQSSTELHLTWKKRSDGGGERITAISLILGPDPEGSPVVAGIALKSQLLRGNLEMAALKALGAPGTTWRDRESLWFERKDLASFFGEAGDHACRLRKEEGHSPDMRVALGVNCGSLVLASPGTLMIVDSTYLAKLGGGGPPRRLAPVIPSGPGATVSLEEPPADVDALARLIAEGRPFRFNETGLLLTAGFATALLEGCPVYLGTQDLAELQSFVQSGKATALTGRQYSSPDLGATLGSQMGSAAIFGLGATAGDRLRCSEPAASKAGAFIADLVRLNRSGGVGGGKTFLASCAQSLSDGQCTCLAQMAVGVYPDIYDRTYSRDMLYSLTQNAPLVAWNIFQQCRISNY